MYGLHGVTFTQHNITLVAEPENGTQKKNTACNTQSLGIYCTEYGVAFDQAVYEVQKNIGAASKFQQGAVGNNSGIIFFRHPINFIHMQFQDPQFCRVDRWKTKLVGYLPDHNLFHDDRIVPDRFNNSLYPLFAAELKIDDAARYPGLNGGIPLF